MKKLVMLVAAAAMILPLVSSCEKDKPEVEEDVVMEPAATADDAKLISFESNLDSAPILNNDDKTYKFISIEFTEDSRYILVRQLVAEAETKAWGSDISVLIGSFTKENSNTYSLSGDFSGKVEISSNNVTVIVNGESQTSNANITDTVKGTQEQTNANRSWIVKSCIVKITGKGVSIEKSFSGCDFYEIGKYVKDNGVNYDPSKLSGYNIEEIIFTGQNTMILIFTQADDFYGTYTLSGKNIRYVLSMGGTDLMNASASGTLDFPSEGKAKLSLNVAFNNYSGTIEYDLRAKN